MNLATFDLAGASRADVLVLQQQLADAGDYHGNLDGIPGPQTHAALDRFRAKNVPHAPINTVTPGSIDEHSEAIIATLLLPVQSLARQFVLNARDAGINIRIISGYRSYDEQTALYAKGRSAPGPKVTNAPAGWSNHNFRTAFDTGWFLDDGTYADDQVPQRISISLLSEKYHQLGAIGKALGLFWGGDWKSIDDEPHFELIPDWAHGLTESQILAEFRRRTAAGEDLLA